MGAEERLDDLVLVGFEPLPTSVLIVYPSGVLIFLAVTVWQIAHQFGGTGYAVVIYLPEHHAAVSPTADAVHPQCLLESCPLLIVPRKPFQPIDE